MNNLLSIAGVTSAIVENLSQLGTLYYIILNAFGVIAIILKVIEFQLKKRSIVLILALIGSGCWTLYFLLQDDLVSAAMNLISAVQMLVFLQRGKYKWADSKFWFFFFLVVQVTLGIIFFKVWHDVFPIVGAVFNVIMYYVISRRTYRITGFICLVLWVLNGVFKFYPIALINDVFGAISALVAIIRYDVLKNSTEKV